jgi:hypothetical protein
MYFLHTQQQDGISACKDQEGVLICRLRPTKSVAFPTGLRRKLKIILKYFEGGELIIIASLFLIDVTHERKKPSAIKLVGVL